MIKPRVLLKTIVNGVAGIALEVLLAVIFIASGFLVCVLWWGIFR